MKTKLLLMLLLCGACFSCNFEVGDARDEVIRELKEMGFDTERTIGVYPGSSWTIVDSEDVLGVNLNIKPKR